MLASALLSVEQLSWKPPAAAQFVLQKISFQLAANECLALVGPSGCGKSSLLRCLLYLERPTAGTIRWRGKVVGPHNILQFRRAVAYVQQQPTGICTSVADNLAFARGAASLNESQQLQLMERLALSHLALSRPFSQLSVGEQQRLALVRSLTPKPEILLLDEPSSALDETNEKRLEQVIAGYLAEQPHRSAIWVSHQPQQRLRMCTRQLTIGCPSND